jgi:hypothetical protein
VTGVYDRNEYLSEKRWALDAWAALLMEIVGEVERPSNVLVMKAESRVNTREIRELD